MPSVLIEVRTERPPEVEAALINAVHKALVDAFAIPPDDGEIRLLVHAPHRMRVGPSKAKPECYTVIAIDAFAGRSLAAKRRLYQGIAEGLAPFGIPPDHILTMVRDIPLENCGVSGQAACDVDLGFAVNI
jgi:phenylpyruvate tautomerase PptA (4-oxalocrotonate tautomerase family)